MEDKSYRRCRSSNGINKMAISELAAFDLKCMVYSSLYMLVSELVLLAMLLDKQKLGLTSDLGKRNRHAHHTNGVEPKCNDKCNVN